MRRERKKDMTSKRLPRCREIRGCKERERESRDEGNRKSKRNKKVKQWQKNRYFKRQKNNYDKQTKKYKSTQVQWPIVLNTLQS